MERQRERHKKPPEDVKEQAGKELDELKKELEKLKALKSEKEQLEKDAAERNIIKEEDLKIADLSYIEDQFDKLESVLNSQIGDVDSKTYKRYAKQIESDLQELEEEIIGEKGLIEKKVTAYEKLINAYPWFYFFKSLSEIFYINVSKSNFLI